MAIKRKKLYEFRISKTVLAIGLALSVAAGASAQSNTAGAIAGRANAGETITVTNPNTGFIPHGHSRGRW